MHPNAPVSRSTRALVVLMLLAWCFLPGDATAVDDSDPLPEVLNSSHFLHYHPDLRFRNLGMESYNAGHFDKAVERFKRAARYADKPSQAMLAEMYWNGEAGPVNRAAAYAWMDLAAERGYALFVGKREAYWAAMSSLERTDALRYGKGMYEEYGDAVGKKQMAHQLRKGRMKTTGSRVGYIGNLSVQIVGPTGRFMSIPAHKVYDPRLWREREYYEWQDRVWRKPVVGIVSVGEMEVDLEGIEMPEDAADKPKQ